MARKKVDEPQIKVGNIADVSGEINVAAGDIYKGFTAEQVSILIKQISSTFQPKKFDGRCPYKGLDVFEEEDSELFFGREELVKDLVTRMKESRTVFITGPSGSGKSSLVRAGLLYVLSKKRAIKNSGTWKYETIKPGRDPLEALALVFSRLKSPELANYFRQHVNQANVLHECAESVLSERTDQRFILFIDQFEEVFTQVGKEKAEIFINILTNAATLENGRVTILFTMRSDFVSNCAAYPQLNTLLNQQFIQIGAMLPAELVSAIAQPALRVGLRIDPELIAQIINDMQGEPGALPLMQFALKDLFESQQAKGGVIALLLSDYLERGGVHKSLERHADDAFAKLSRNEQKLARSIFSRLIEIGRSTQGTRRTAFFNEFIPANRKAEDVKAVVQKLADARLVTIGEQAGKDTVTISHEKLIDAWPWLKKLVNENRDVFALQNEIATDAQEWDDHKRDASYLYIGARLANAREKVDAKKLVLIGLAELFIEAGVKAHTDELETAKQRATQLRRYALNLTAALVVALIAVGVAIFFSRQSRQQTKISRAGELAGQVLAYKDDRMDLAALLSIEAFRRMDTYQSRRSLLTVVQKFSRVDGFIWENAGKLDGIAFSPDGKQLAFGAQNGNVILLNSQTRTRTNVLEGHSGAIQDLVYNPNGKILAVASCRGNTINSACNQSEIVIWNLSTFQPIKNIAEKSAVYSLTFSPDGSYLAFGAAEKVIFWDVAKNQKADEWPLEMPKDDKTIYAVAISPDGKYMAVGLRSKVLVYDTSKKITLTILALPSNVPARSLKFSPQNNPYLNGAYLAVGDSANEVSLWRLNPDNTWTLDGYPLIGHSNPVIALDFSPDGKFLASASIGSIRLWDMENRSLAGEPLNGYGYIIGGIDFSPDGTLLASTSEEAVILWNVNGKPPAFLKKFNGGNVNIQSLAFGDEETLFSTDEKGLALAWEINNAHPQHYDEYRANSPWLLTTFNLDGTLLGVASCEPDCHLLILDTASWNVVTQIPFTGARNLTTLAFNRENSLLAGGDANGVIRLWDLSINQLAGAEIKEHCCHIYSLAFSPDGKTLASGGCGNTYCDKGEIMLWDVSTQTLKRKLPAKHASQVSALAFSPDGNLLASGGFDRLVYLWDITKEGDDAQSLNGHVTYVNSVIFSPDGKMLVSAGSDLRIIIWDVQSHQKISEFVNFHTSHITDLAFNKNGTLLASGGGRGQLIAWSFDPSIWEGYLCKAVGRNFTKNEWQFFFPGEKYQATCPQLPSSELETINNTP